MRKRSFFALHRATSLCLLCSAGLAACSSGKTSAPPNPPPEVGVVTLHPQPVTITTDLPGRTVAYRIAEVRPQVSGVILKRLFTEGSEVKAGQQLYQIDPAPFQANVESAQASLARARATLKSATLLTQRYKPLAEAHAVSQQDYDNAIAAESQAAAWAPSKANRSRFQSGANDSGAIDSGAIDARSPSTGSGAFRSPDARIHGNLNQRFGCSGEPMAMS